MIKTETDLLGQARRVRELISKPDNWIKFTYCRNKLGEAVNPWDEDAYSFCILGAIRKISGQFHGNLAQDLSNWLYKFDKLSLSKFNDNSTHDEILNLLDKYIEFLTEKDGIKEEDS